MKTGYIFIILFSLILSFGLYKIYKDVKETAECKAKNDIKLTGKPCVSKKEYYK